MALPLPAGIGALAADVGPVTPAFPVGVAVDHVMILIAENAVTSPVDVALTIADQGGGTWAPIGGFGGSHAGNAHRLTLFWSRYDGVQTPPTTNDTGDHQFARIIAFSRCRTTGSPINAEAGGAPTFPETISTIPSVTTDEPDCLIVEVIAGELPDIDGADVFSSWTNSGLVNLTELLDFSSAVGSGGSIGVATGQKAIAGTTGATTVAHANWRVAYKKFALIGTEDTPPETGFGMDTSVTPYRATRDGATFFPRIAYDSGDSGFNFADQAVAARNLGQYRFTTYLNYQFGPISKVLDQLTPLVPLGMHGIATGNSVTVFPALVAPGPLTATVTGTAGNVNVGAHSYKVAYRIPALFNGVSPIIYDGGATSNIVTVTTSGKIVHLSNIPIGPPGTEQRYIYRTVAGDTGPWKLALILPNNTTTDADDDVADASLGANVTSGSLPFAVTENPLVSGTPFRTYFDGVPGAGGAYLTDEPRRQDVGTTPYLVPENAVYWHGLFHTEMPHLPTFSTIYSEGPLVPETSAGSGVESQFGSAGWMEHVLGPANIYWWCRNLPAGNDWIGMDPYPNFHNETDTVNGVGAQGGFPHFYTADCAAWSVAAAGQNGKIPVVTIQLFGPFQQGRFPDVPEMWAHPTMCVVEGARGIAWWQIGTNLGLADQTEPTKTNATAALAEITQFLEANEAAILSTPITSGWTNSTRSGTALAWRMGVLPTVANASRQTSFGSNGRGTYQAELNALTAGVTAWSPMLDQNGNVRQRVFQKTAATFLVFAYNYHPAAVGSVTFTAPSPIQSITVIGESRTITPTGATWVDSFGGASSLAQANPRTNANRISHIYEVTTSAEPAPGVPTGTRLWPIAI